MTNTNILMAPEKADLYTESLNLSVGTHDYAWRGVVGFTLTERGYEILRLTEDDVKDAVTSGEEINEATGLPYGMYDAASAGVMIKDMLFEAFTTGKQIHRWAMFLPDVAQKLDDKALGYPNAAVQHAIDNIKDLEVCLVAAGKRGSKFRYPRLNLWAKGSKPSNKPSRRVVRRAA